MQKSQKIKFSRNLFFGHKIDFKNSVANLDDLPQCARAFRAHSSAHVSYKVHNQGRKWRLIGTRKQ